MTWPQLPEEHFEVQRKKLSETNAKFSSRLFPTHSKKGWIGHLQKVQIRSESERRASKNGLFETELKTSTKIWILLSLTTQKRDKRMAAFREHVCLVCASQTFTIHGLHNNCAKWGTIGFGFCLTSNKFTQSPLHTPTPVFNRQNTSQAISMILRCPSQYHWLCPKCQRSRFISLHNTSPPSIRSCFCHHFPLTLDKTRSRHSHNQPKVESLDHISKAIGRFILTKLHYDWPVWHSAALFLWDWTRRLQELLQRLSATAILSICYCHSTNVADRISSNLAKKPCKIEQKVNARSSIGSAAGCFQESDCSNLGWFPLQTWTLWFWLQKEKTESAEHWISTRLQGSHAFVFRCASRGRLIHFPSARKCVFCPSITFTWSLVSAWEQHLTPAILIQTCVAFTNVNPAICVKRSNAGFPWQLKGVCNCTVCQFVLSVEAPLLLKVNSARFPHRRIALIKLQVQQLTGAFLQPLTEHAWGVVQWMFEYSPLFRPSERFCVLLQFEHLMIRVASWNKVWHFHCH